MFVQKNLQGLTDEQLHTRITMAGNFSISIGPHQIHEQQMQRVLQPHRKLTDSIINAYMGLAASKLAKQQIIPGFLLPFHILNNVVSSMLSSQPSILLFKPRLQLQKMKLWMPEVSAHPCIPFHALTISKFVHILAEYI
jgi:hypothetical protein